MNHGTTIADIARRGLRPGSQDEAALLLLAQRPYGVGIVELAAELGIEQLVLVVALSRMKRAGMTRVDHAGGRHWLWQITDAGRVVLEAHIEAHRELFTEQEAIMAMWKRTWMGNMYADIVPPAR